MSSIDISSARERLLAWYLTSRRDLPWRAAGGEVPDPYHVWLSEVMLQQTRVETVKPYFERWLRRFPGLTDLADAEADDVLKAWEGLGYYSRARNFHRAAREVMASYGGVVPTDAGVFRSLPGVGPYTEGAVMSIAFGQRRAAVDGNVRRVISRLTDDPDPDNASLWTIASEFADAPNPGDVNQALMELGATVCLPRTPRCDDCPLLDLCIARSRGTQRDRPARTTKRPRPREEHGVAVVLAGDRLLLVRRPAAGRLAGMWEFPGLTLGGDEDACDTAIRAAAELGGVAVLAHAKLGNVRHIFTHVEVSYMAFLVRPVGPVDSAGGEGVEWITRGEIARFALPSAQHRILELVDSYVERDIDSRSKPSA